ncbi:MAG TPA: FAD:protein FMN transferase [Candidatus Eisenbacteria bacterium]|nr:FAD:protein FMN transferase [Candidatus Eisenbacteria bacterium]
MASPCEVLVDTDDLDEAAHALRIAETEAQRIEAKFSRYRPDNVVHRINHAGGVPVRVDAETAQLLDFAASCHEMSGGLFDITSGSLRRAWTFDGGTRVPEASQLRALLEHVGWSKVRWDGTAIAMPAGMEIDLGGFGKEYAVDRAAGLVRDEVSRAILVNFGGDLVASGARRDGRPWSVGIEDPERPGAAALYRIEVDRGGIATSGDARRFVLWRGKRLGHILDPRTGWPVEGGPRSVTVLAATCLEAGTLATLAQLQGAGARAFLDAQGARYWTV